MTTKSLFFALITGLVPCFLFSCGNLNNEEAPNNADYAAFKTEKTAWETNAVREYYLTLTHANGSSRYTTASIVKDGTPEYVETGGASVTLTGNFPFPPLAQTIQEIYELLEEKFSDNASVEVVFDTQSHIPKSVTIKNYNGSGNDYLLTVDFIVAAKGDEPLDTASGEYRDVEEFDMDLFRAEKEAWLAQNIQNYQFTSTNFPGFPPVPVLTIVSPDAEPKLEYPADFPENEFGYPSGEDLLIPYGKTIEEIYSRIEYIINEDALPYVKEDPANGVRIKITYNAEYHYPEYFFVSKYDLNVMLIGNYFAIFEILDFEHLD
ncbi:MAG: DUF6174 domain-containing protein [Treponema sp.]|jgi:hypothetical protein|nr:DUF6174 domain-containing protein [Treponema sp.]